MHLENFVLQGKHVRLEPLLQKHCDALVAAVNGGDDLYQWSPVPKTKSEAMNYIKTAIAWHDAGTAVPFVTVREADNLVIGSTRFWNIEYWSWPEGHALQGRKTPDACEIGYTWLAPSSVRTAANTEAKLLMLRYAFETWQVHRVCFHTDVRNDRSRTALARIGGKFEGILRSHRMAADFIPRDSARFSILAAEWPAARQKLIELLEKR